VQGRELQEAAPAPIFCFFMASGMNLARFLRMVCQLTKARWMSLNKFIGRVPFLTKNPKTASLKST
jgi:hypothetical protein